MFDAFFSQVTARVEPQVTARLKTSSEEDKINRDALRGEFREKNKKISQLIAKSWLPNDPEGAEIRQVILRNVSEEIKDLLKKYDVDIDEFLGSIVGGPIHVKVSWDTFAGKLDEIPGSQGSYVLPYPPRPVEVTDEHLEEWVNNTDPNTPMPPYPYIPLTGF
jgi:hypothetical protein